MTRIKITRKPNLHLKCVARIFGHNHFWTKQLLKWLRSPRHATCDVTFKLAVVVISQYQGCTQGCSANKNGVGTHPKNSHFETALKPF